jgi:hypothetical protein
LKAESIPILASAGQTLGDIEVALLLEAADLPQIDPDFDLPYLPSSYHHLRGQTRILLVRKGLLFLELIRLLIDYRISDLLLQ